MQQQRHEDVLPPSPPRHSRPLSASSPSSASCRRCSLCCAPSSSFSSSSSASFSPSLSGGLRIALIAPDSLSSYATLLHQAFINALQRQRQQLRAETETDTEREQDDDEAARPRSADAQHAAPLSCARCGSASDAAPLLSAVSLYIHMPEESSLDFILRMQRGALPHALYEQQITAIITDHQQQQQQRFLDEDDDDADDERAEPQHQQDEEEEEEEEAVEDEAGGDLATWRLAQAEAAAQRDEQVTEATEAAAAAAAAEEEAEARALWEEADSLPQHESAAHSLLSSLHAALFTPRHDRHNAQQQHSVQQTVQVATAEEEEEDEEAAGLRIHEPQEADREEEEAAAAAAAAAAGSISSPVSIPPLDFSRLVSSSGWHVNLLLYDGLREDIAFSYFQFMQHLSHQLRQQSDAASSSSSSSPSAYIPPTVLLLYNGWQTLHRCEQDEESEERTKKLLNLADVVVVCEQELCDAYRQLCPNVVCIPHGYAVGMEQTAETTGRDCALSPPLSSSSVSTLSSASSSSSCSSSQSSSLLFSSTPRAPVPSPASSPRRSQRSPSLPQLPPLPSPPLSSFHHRDIVHAVNEKRDRLHAPVLPFLSSPLPHPHSPTAAADRHDAVTAASSAAPPPIFCIGYVPTEDEADEAHSISWPDVWALYAALKTETSAASASSSSAVPACLWFLHGAPVTAAEEGLVVFLTASHLEQHSGGSFSDLLSLKRFLYQQSVQGSRAVVVYGMFVRQDVASLCSQLLDFELRVSRDVDDGGWVGGRMAQAVPVVLEISNSLAARRQGAQLICIERSRTRSADKQPAAAAAAAAAGGSDKTELEDEEEKALPVSDSDELSTVHPEAPLSSLPLSRCSSFSSVSSSSSFSFSPSHHLYAADKYDYAAAARALLSLMRREDGLAAALRCNLRVIQRWSLDRVAVMYLLMMEQQHIVSRARGDREAETDGSSAGSGGRDGAMVTLASWYPSSDLTGW